MGPEESMTIFQRLRAVAENRIPHRVDVTPGFGRIRVIAPRREVEKHGE